MNECSPAVDVALIRQVAALMDANGLSELTFNKIDNTVKVKAITYTQFKVYPHYDEGF